MLIWGLGWGIANKFLYRFMNFRIFSIIKKQVAYWLHHVHIGLATQRWGETWQISAWFIGCDFTKWKKLWNAALVTCTHMYYLCIFRVCAWKRMLALVQINQNTLFDSVGDFEINYCTVKKMWNVLVTHVTEWLQDIISKTSLVTYQILIYIYIYIHLNLQNKTSISMTFEKFGIVF